MLKDVFDTILELETKLKEDPEEFKKAMINIGVNLGTAFLYEVVTEYLPKLKEKMAQNKEAKAQEKQEVILEYETILQDLKYKNQNDLSLSAEEYEQNLEKIATLEKKIKSLKGNNGGAKVAGTVALALGTGGISLVAVALAKKFKKDKKIKEDK
ncbi:MAG: hypothetical protein J6C97_02590 [Clostridia bacterium]|nr:hypothetical protein [Clostridia bacterium]